jgi:hypothetical protein
MPGRTRSKQPAAEEPGTQDVAMQEAPPSHQPEVEEEAEDDDDLDLPPAEEEEEVQRVKIVSDFMAR